jgi:signal transduction histidine kinase
MSVSTPSPPGRKGRRSRRFPGVCKVVSWVFTCAPSSVPLARRHIRAVLGSWHVPEGDPAGEVWEDLELVVGELAGNASKFCRGRIEMKLEVHRDRVRLEVLDDGAAMESLHLTPPGPPRLDAESGRGLVIVSALANSWGAERTTTSVAGGSGTKVWAEMAFRSVSPHFTRGCEFAAV